jgi:alkyl hydroperoxide reductase subunit D
MSALEVVRASIPEAAKDIKHILQDVLQSPTLSPAQRWGVAVAAAVAARQADQAAAVALETRDVPSAVPAGA